MAYKFHVALWRDAEGQYTGRTLDGTPAVALDATPADVLGQLKRYLTWVERQGELMPPALEACDVRSHAVVVRAEYPGEPISHPVNPPIALRVLAVHARREDDLRFAVLPTLGVAFAHQATDPADELVADAVRTALSRKTPQELSRYLAPERLSVETLFVRETKRKDAVASTTARTAPAVADPLGLRVRGRRGVRAIGRAPLVANLAARLTGEKSNLLLVGEAGVGKTVVLHEAIGQAVRAKREPGKGAASAQEASHGSRRFWTTSGQRLIAGMKYLGQWEARCEELIEELSETAGALCVDDLLELIRTGGREPTASVAAFLAPYLERGELRLIAEATPVQLDACRRLLPGFTELFEVVRVPEFTPTESRAVLAELVADARRNRQLDAAAGLDDLVYRLFKRFQPYAAFPGRCADFVRRVLDDAARRTPRRLDAPHVLEAFRRETGLPEYLLRDDLPLRREKVLDDFRGAVLGQAEACEIAGSVLLTLKAGLNDPRRPLGVLFFCGPTGVGKTELAKVLADRLFGAGAVRDRLVRLDMSEYSGYGAAQRLLMTPEGEASEFLRRVRRQPFCVVLLDEIEKAAPEVHDVLLGLLDEGRLTDRFGRTTSFQSAVVVMTSNVGAERLAPIGLGDAAQPAFERIAMQTFRPEFFNRIDSVVTFRPLSRETVAALARRELAAIAGRDGLVKADLRLTWSEAVVERLIRAGYDARYGARPLQREVERCVVAPLARWLVAHPTARGATVRLDVQENEVRVVQPADGDGR